MDRKNFKLVYLPEQSIFTQFGIKTLEDLIRHCEKDAEKNDN